MAWPPPAAVVSAPVSQRDISVSVVVPTYRRPSDLRRCLTALAAQTHIPDQTLVVLRTSDSESAAVLTEWDESVTSIRVDEPGVVAALNAGVARVTSTVVAFTDDDAEPHPDWLERLLSHYRECSNVGGVGGRDTQFFPGSDREVWNLSGVGRVQLFGRVIGNHHLGRGQSRDVDLLKGANMSYLTSALISPPFDPRLRGRGAQVHNEVGVALGLRRAGWRIVYDPCAVVDHRPGERLDEAGRGQFQPAALTNAVHNETLVLLDFLNLPRSVLFVFWTVLAGTSGRPGLAHTLRLVTRRDRHALAKLRCTMRGRIAGLATALRGRRGDQRRS